MVLAEKSQEGAKGALLEDIITALWAVTSDVTQSPYSLFPDIVHARRQKLDKFWHSSSANDGLSMFSSPRRDVS